MPDDDGIALAILPLTVGELHDDLARPPLEQALYRHLVQDTYRDARELPWTLITLAHELSPGDEARIEALADLAHLSSTAALLNASPALAAQWSPPPRRDQHRYVALFTPSIPMGTWSLPASHALLARMAQSFTAYRHESNCVGPDGHVVVDTEIPSRDTEEAVALAARGLASWSSHGDTVHFASLPSLSLPREVGSFGPRDGWIEAMLPYLLYALRFLRISRLAARHPSVDRDWSASLASAIHQYVTDSSVHDDAFRRAHPLRAAPFRWIDDELWVGMTPTFKLDGCLFRVKLNIPIPPNVVVDKTWAIQMTGG
jgi:hypothetical protein